MKANSRHHVRLVQAFQTSKSIAEWSTDPRCRVTYQVLRNRLDGGWSAEDAISTPNLLSRQRREMLINAFGESKTLSEWGEDERAKVPAVRILWRIQRGIPPELAIATGIDQNPGSAKSAPVVYEGFGEKKSLAEWLRDPRCAVSRQVLVRNLKQMPVEQALTFKKQRVIVRGSKAASQFERPPIDLDTMILYLASGAEIWKAKTESGARVTLLYGTDCFELDEASLQSLLDAGQVRIVETIGQLTSYGLG